MGLLNAGLLIGALFAAATLQADAVSVDAMVQCGDTVGTSSCFAVNSFASNYYSYNISAAPDATTGSIGGGVNSFFVPGGPTGTVSSMITLTLSLTTEGPIRPGTLSYLIDVTADGSQSSFGGGWYLAGMSQSGTCDFDCGAFGEESFTLGEPFQVSLTGHASTAGNHQSDAGFTGSFTLSMFDENGTPVDILPYDGDGPFLTPEPASVWQLGLGAGALSLLFSRRRKLHLQG